MINKIKILKFMEIHFFSKQKAEHYYLDLELQTISNKANPFTFKVHLKWSLYLLSLISSLFFLYFYYNDIKVFSLFLNIINDNLTNINVIIENVNTNKIILSDWIVWFKIIIQDKWLRFIILLVILFILFLIIYGMETALDLIVKWIYRRINYMFNLWIFLSILNLDIIMYFEYNFFFILYIFSIILKNIMKSIIYRDWKLILDSSFCHFLTIPYILFMISFLLFIVQSLYFWKIFYHVLELNKKFFVTSDYVFFEKIKDKIE